MKSLFKALGIFFVISGLIFLFVYSAIVTGSPNEPFARDLFGFPIPHPPIWTSYIPYLGSFFRFIFESFSIHGVVGIIISVIFFSIGGFILELNEKN